jgi:hypothetical protein
VWLGKKLDEQLKDMRFKANRRADKNQDQQLLTKLKVHLVSGATIKYPTGRNEN